MNLKDILELARKAVTDGDMDKAEKLTAQAKAMQALDAMQPAEPTADPELNELREFKAKVENEPATKSAGFVTVTKDEADRKAAQPWRSFGEYLQAVKTAGMTQGARVDPRLKATGLSEGINSDGGFLVQTDFTAQLLRRTYETGVLASRARRVPISANANGLTLNALDETSRATGSRLGGITSYWLGEGGTKTASAPTFRQMELRLKKLIGLCYATDELLNDAMALENVISTGFAEEFGWMIDNAMVRGTGAGQPLGVLNAAPLVSVAKEVGQAATTLVYDNVLKMWSRMWAPSRANSVWLVNQDVEPQLWSMDLPVGTGGLPVMLPPGGASASPYMTLFGRPIIPIEQCSTLGTQGDIILADWSQYVMIEKGGIEAASSIHVQFTTDETAFRFVLRADGQPSWNAALTPANGTNTLSPFVTLDTRA